MEKSRTITLEEVESAVFIIRDSILTDENVTTFFSAAQKLANAAFDIYQYMISIFGSEEVDPEIEKEVEEKVQEYDIPTLDILYDIQKAANGDKSALKDELDGLEPSNTRSISMDGIIAALTFIQKHVNTAGDILHDLYTILNAIRTIELYKSQVADEKSRGIIVHRKTKLQEHEQDILKQFIDADTNIYKLM